MADRIGELRHRITVEENTAVVGKEYEAECKRWAKIIGAGSDDDGQAWELTFRYFPGLSMKHLIRWGGKRLEIFDIADPDGMKEWHEVKATEPRNP